MDLQSIFENFESTSPWMSPTGGTSIPAFLNTLDVARYVNYPGLSDQPIIVRVGVGLLVIDVIPLALDLVVGRFLLQKLFGIGLAPENVTMNPDILTASEAISFFDQNQGKVSARSTQLLSAFYRMLFNTNFSSPEPPELLLFSLFTQLGPAFQAVSIRLAEDRWISSQSVLSKYLLSNPTSSNTETELLLQLKSAEKNGIVDNARVLYSSPIGALYEGRYRGVGMGAGVRAVVGVRPSLPSEPDSELALPTIAQLEEILLDLYITRRLLLSVSSYPSLTEKVQGIVSIVEQLMNECLQMKRVFSPEAGQIYGSQSVGIVPFSSIYSD